MKRIKKGERVTLATGSYAGQTLVFDGSYHRAGEDKAIRYASLVTEDGKTARTAALLPDVFVISDLAAGVLDEFKSVGAAYRAAEEAKHAEWMKTRRAEKLAEYVATRRENLAKRALRTEQSRDDDDGTLRIKYDPMSEETYVRSLIELTAAPSSFFGGVGIPRVEINWSAIGSVAPEKALAFGLALIEAAHRAIDERAKLEEAAGIDIHAPLPTTEGE